jgi:uncharacterized RDD family membrane protein YckC
MQPTEWFYAQEGQQVGPVPEAEINRLVRDGHMLPTNLVWHTGLENWVPWNSLYPTTDTGVPPIPSNTAAPPRASRFVYGGFWIRSLAYIIDAILIGAIRSIILIPLGIGIIERPFASPWFFMHLGQAELAGVALSLCYFVFFWTQYGATPGKMILKLKVVNPLGGPITVGQAVGRYFSQILSGLIFGIGFMMAGWDEEKRALHDRLCDTRVIRLNEIGPLGF